MAIEGYVGRPGSGKSYTLTDRAISEARRGRQVFANYPIEHEGCWTFRPDQLMDLPPGVVVIDEAHLWFPSRMSLKLPVEWLAMLSQTRKNGWDLLWAAQHESRIDRVVRDNTAWQWHCSAWFGTADRPAFFLAKSYEPEYFRQPKKMYTKRLRMFSQKVADSYNTFERLQLADHVDAESGVYAKQSSKGATRATGGRRGPSVLEGTRADV